MEITQDLHQMEISIPDNPLGHVNVYAIRDDEAWTIVDAGYNHEEAHRSLVNQIGELAGAITNVKRIIITHWHPDHFGLARRVRAESGAQVLMHERDVKTINRILSNNSAPSRTQIDWLVLNGMPSEEVADISAPRIEKEGEFKPDVILHGGEQLRIGRFVFNVIVTPGHTLGHICLHEPKERLLISGDHILPVITPSITYHYDDGGNPLESFLNSLRSLSELDVSLVLPAHEQPFSDLRGRIQEIEKHHRDRCDEIVAALDGSPKSAYEICAKITWAEGLMQWDDMPQFHRMLAIGETIAHLYYMQSHGITEIAAENGKQLWTKTTTTK